MNWEYKIETAAKQLLKISTSDYATQIWKNIGIEMVADVLECSAVGEGRFSDDDVRFAVGRVLCRRLGIKY